MNQENNHSERYYSTIVLALENQFPGISQIYQRAKRGRELSSADALLYSVAHYSQEREESMKRIEKASRAPLPFWDHCVRYRDRIVFPEMAEPVTLYMIESLERVMPGLKRKVDSYRRDNRTGSRNLTDVLLSILTEREIRLSAQRAEAAAILEKAKGKVS